MSPTGHEPLAVGIDYIMNGRTARFANVILGAVLSVPARLVTVIVGGWPMRGVPAVSTLQRAMGQLASLEISRSLLPRPSAVADRRPLGHFQSGAAFGWHAHAGDRVADSSVERLQSHL